MNAPGDIVRVLNMLPPTTRIQNDTISMVVGFMFQTRLTLRPIAASPSPSQFLISAVRRVHSLRRSEIGPEVCFRARRFRRNMFNDPKPSLRTSGFRPV